MSLFLDEDEVQKKNNENLEELRSLGYEVKEDDRKIDSLLDLVVQLARKLDEQPHWIIGDDGLISGPYFESKVIKMEGTSMGKTK